jgi:hypothetical protein
MIDLFTPSRATSEPAANFGIRRQAETPCSDIVEEIR